MLTYRGFRTESSKFGISPCLSVDANATICFFAPSKFPVVRNKPLSEMNTSRPQQRAQPAVKCGRPAASDGVGLPGSSDAERTRPCICTALSARSCVNAWPEATKSDICSIAARRAALYAVETTMAKNLGRRKGGREDLMREKRAANHSAGAFSAGKVSVCLSFGVSSGCSHWESGECTSQVGSGCSPAPTGPPANAPRADARGRYTA